MSKVIPFPKPEDQPKPEDRAQIVAGILLHVASTPDAVSYSAVFDRALKEAGQPEEKVGPDIVHAVSCLVLSGLLDSNTYSPQTGQLIFTAGMTVVAGRGLIGFVWGEDSSEEDSREVDE